VSTFDADTLYNTYLTNNISQSLRSCNSQLTGSQDFVFMYELWLFVFN